MTIMYSQKWLYEGIIWERIMKELYINNEFESSLVNLVFLIRFREMDVGPHDLAGKKISRNY